MLLGLLGYLRQKHLSQVADITLTRLLLVLQSQIYSGPRELRIPWSGL